jgi:hypothetical protein
MGLIPFLESRILAVLGFMPSILPISLTSNPFTPLLSAVHKKYKEFVENVQQVIDLICGDSVTYIKEIIMERKKVQIGDRFGRLTVISGEVRNGKKLFYKCQCDCGNTVFTRRDHLLSGASRSCKCLSRETVSKTKSGNKYGLKHGLSNTRICKIWYGMLDRCQNEKHKFYFRYGGRGIKVCDEWRLDVATFYNWAIQNGYSDSLTLDRIDVNGNYEPSNCRWATWEQQNNNKSDNNLIEYHGLKRTLSEWAKYVGIDTRVLDRRLAVGWTLDKALLGKRYNSHGVLLERTRLLPDGSGIDESSIQGFEVEE